MNTLRFRAAFLVLVFFVSTSLFSQSSNGTISGTVADSSGAVIPGVTVTATNNATGIVTTVLSNDSGVYNFASLLPGTYKISAEAQGFKRYQRDNFSVGSGERETMDISLEIGQVNESVNVTAEASLLETATASAGQVISGRSVANLPMNGRDVVDAGKPGVLFSKQGFDSVEEQQKTNQQSKGKYTLQACHQKPH